MKNGRARPSPRVVKIIFMSAVLIAIVFLAIGNWFVVVCMMVGAFLMEKNIYRCPNCDHKLNMKVSLRAFPLCPACGTNLLKSS